MHYSSRGVADAELISQNPNDPLRYPLTEWSQDRTSVRTIVGQAGLGYPNFRISEEDKKMVKFMYNWKDPKWNFNQWGFSEGREAVAKEVGDVGGDVKGWSRGADVDFGYCRCSWGD